MSATTTSCPNVSCDPLTVGLGASITIRAVGRPPGTAAKRSGSVGIRRSTSSPATTPERRRHATQPPGAAGASDAATPEAVAGSSPSLSWRDGRRHDADAGHRTPRGEVYPVGGSPGAATWDQPATTERARTTSARCGSSASRRSSVRLRPQLPSAEPAIPRPHRRQARARGPIPPPNSC